MCGVVGQVSLRGETEWDSVRFRYALSLLSKRGPDDAGIFEGRTAILGHRRLIVIDPDSRARQPMLSRDGRFVLVFNGEIYNFRELRKDLEGKGHRFRTRGDSEVLLNALIEWDVEALSFLNGMFAFAFWDGLRRRLIIARDRFGIKPLFHRVERDTLIFASEIKSILALQDTPRRLDLEAVSSYLSYRYPVAGNTFFEGTSSLPAAHFAEVRDDRIRFVEYWDPAPFFEAQQEDRGEEYYLDTLQELMASSVGYRMISDVPVGAFLSGGLDSSITSVLMAGQSKHPLETFSIGFEEDGHNEFKYARLVADSIGAKHHEILFSASEYLDTMSDLSRLRDAPLSVPNEVPLHAMSRDLKKHVTVVLSGEGADELFGGYGRIFRSPYDLERKIALQESNWTSDEKSTFAAAFFDRYRRADFQTELEHFLYQYRYVSLEKKEGLFSPSIDIRSLEERSTSVFEELFSRLSKDSYTNRIMYSFVRLHLPGLLARLDFTTMQASVEGRVPFLDHRLAEFAFGIPRDLLLRWRSPAEKAKGKLMLSDIISERLDQPKYILRRAFGQLLPEEIVQRRKLGFPVPLSSWFRSEHMQFARNILLDPGGLKGSVLNSSAIEDCLTQSEQGFSNAKTLWFLVSLELFNKAYLKDRIYRWTNESTGQASRVQPADPSFFSRA